MAPIPVVPILVVPILVVPILVVPILVPSILVPSILVPSILVPSILEESILEESILAPPIPAAPCRMVPALTAPNCANPIPRCSWFRPPPVAKRLTFLTTPIIRPLGQVHDRPLHLVVADDEIMGATVVVSVYEPDEAHGWDPAGGFRKRKEDPDEE